MVALQYVICLLSILHVTVRVSGKCSIPDYFHGEWYSRGRWGDDVITKITADKWDSNEDETELNCEDLFIHPNPGLQQAGNNVTMFMVSSGGSGSCYFCVDVLWRTSNILQYRKGDCIPAYVGYGISLNISCKAMNPLYGLPLTADTVTMFRQIPRPVNCQTMFKGLYQFTYEMDQGGGGICDNPDNQIKACQDPGSRYVDNEVFSMTYASCPNVLASKDKNLRYQCMGTWDAEQHGMVFTFAAVVDILETEPRVRYQCLMTSKSQKGEEKRWVMSRFAECSSLNSIYSAPVRLVLRSTVPTTGHMISRCNMPKDLAGEWETKGSGFKFDVVINETNIRFQTEPNAIEFLDSIFACQKKSGTRYLMTRVMAGECEDVYVCMDIVPQTNNTLRYRIGKPEPIPLDVPRGELDITRMFRIACHWFDRVGIKGNQGYEILSRKVNIN
ncbi:uncharacterized protein LOC134237464 isoform X1 [Saccostrea cucullata]|uniref:uncharacterized protein LOC134237464 isoform X1 n=1 Tax=Saccostrea cuccullata TaxID=36930 RepID=UPI002ED1380E